MTDRSKKVTELTALTNATGEDLLVIVDSPSANAETKKITVSNFVANVQANAVFKHNLTVSGDLFSSAIHEPHIFFTGANGIVNHDCSNGHFFCHINAASDFIANFTNLNLQNGYSTNINIIINQNGTPYRITEVRIANTVQPIKWPNGLLPSGSSNSCDLYTFTIINYNGSYNALGKLEDFTFPT